MLERLMFIVWKIMEVFNFLSKITAPDMNASDKFGISVSQSGNL